MTFLNPFFLFGLAAASLPVLFHLFARKKSRRIEFSSLRFLQKLEKTSMRAVKIRQLLLLIVRTLLITALVLAFARPALRGYMGSFFGSSHANTAMIFLIDNSASMSRSDNRGELLKQAKQAAILIAGVMEDGDDAVVIPLASITRGSAYSPIHSRVEVLSAINKVQIADRPASLADGMRLASSILSQSRDANKEVYLFSDDQARNFRDEKTGLNFATDSARAPKLFDMATRFYTMRLGQGEHLNGRNLSLDSLATQTTIFEPGHPVSFEAWVRNTTADPAQNVMLSLFYNGERVAQQSITSISGGETERVLISGPARGAGIIKVAAQLEPDALPFDNMRYTTLDIPRTRRIGIFMDDPSNAQFIRIALEQTLLRSAEAAPFTVDVKPTNQIRSLSTSASSYDGVMIGLGPSALATADLDALKRYVMAGNGAAIFLLPNVNIAATNGDLATLGLPAITREEGTPDDFTQYRSFASLEFANPFFSGMFQTSPTNNASLQGIASPKIYQSYDLAPSSGLTLIKLTNGSPMLLESALGKGDILLYGIPPTLAYSDFPQKAIFLPFIRRTAAYISSVHTRVDENQPEHFVTTEPFNIRLPSLSGVQPGATVLVQAPDESSSVAHVLAAPDGAPELRIDRAPLSGNYTVFRDAEARDAIAAFAVNIQSDESDLRTVPPSEAQKYFAARMANPKPSITNLNPADAGLAKTVEQSRYGVELWQSFLWAAFILAIIELILAREARSVGESESSALESLHAN